MVLVTVFADSLNMTSRSTAGAVLLITVVGEWVIFYILITVKVFYACLKSLC